MGDYRTLLAFQKGFALAMEIYQLTKSFPKEEQYDSETENGETQVWLDFSLACNYITQEKFNALSAKNEEVGKLIWYMINNPDKFR